MCVHYIMPLAKSSDGSLQVIPSSRHPKQSQNQTSTQGITLIHLKHGMSVIHLSYASLNDTLDVMTFNLIELTGMDNTTLILDR